MWRIWYAEGNGEESRKGEPDEKNNASAAWQIISGRSDYSTAIYMDMLPVLEVQLSVHLCKHYRPRLCYPAGVSHSEPMDESHPQIIMDFFDSVIPTVWHIIICIFWARGTNQKSQTAYGSGEPPDAQLFDTAGNDSRRVKG